VTLKVFPIAFCQAAKRLTGEFTRRGYYKAIRRWGGMMNQIADYSKISIPWRTITFGKSSFLELLFRERKVQFVTDEAGKPHETPSTPDINFTGKDFIITIRAGIFVRSLRFTEDVEFYFSNAFSLRTLWKESWSSHRHEWYATRGPRKAQILIDRPGDLK